MTSVSAVRRGVILAVAIGVPFAVLGVAVLRNESAEANDRGGVAPVPTVEASHPPTPSLDEWPEATFPIKPRASGPATNSPGPGKRDPIRNAEEDAGL